MRTLSQFITRLIDFFYPPFRRLMPQQVFRYAACGGGNMVLDWVLYFLVYNFVIGHEVISLSFPSFIFHHASCIMHHASIVISPHIASLCIVFPITLFTGFWLNKYVTFSASSLRGIRQLGRYMLVVAVNLLINYVGLHLCVDLWGWFPTPSKMFITLVTILVSFFGQKYFSFRA